MLLGLDFISKGKVPTLESVTSIRQLVLSNLHIVTADDAFSCPVFLYLYLWKCLNCNCRCNRYSAHWETTPSPTSRPSTAQRSTSSLSRASIRLPCRPLTQQPHLQDIKRS